MENRSLTMLIFMFRIYFLEQAGDMSLFIDVDVLG